MAVSRQHCRGYLGAAALLLVASHARAGDWTLDNGIDLQLVYTDNLSLSSNPEAGFIASVSPSLGLRGEGRGLKGSFSYAPTLSAQYGDADQGHAISHRLSSAFTATLKEQTLFLDMTATALLAPTTASAAYSRDGLNLNDDLQQVYGFSLAPHSVHRFGSYASLNLRASVDTVYGYADTTNLGLGASLVSGPRFPRFPWSLSFSHGQSLFAARTDRRSSFTATGGYRINRKWLVNASLGKQYNQVYSARSDTDGLTTSASVNWTPTPRTRASASLGHSYFGQTWNVDISHISRRTRWALAYNQSLTNVSQTLLQEGLFDVQLPDGTVVTLPGYVYSTLDEDYISRRLYGSVRVTGRRTEFGLGVNMEKREYEVTPAGERVLGVSASASRKLSPKLKLAVSTGWQDVRSDLGADDRVYDIGLSASLGVGRYSNLGAAVSHRRSDRVGGGYTENRLSLSFSTKMF